jgi:phage-related minor tail protein
MGEAGPEAIIPLKRGANGSLGISGGSGISNNVEINITIDSAGNAQSSSSDTASMAGQLGGLIKQAVSQELIRQTRPGGLLAR